eukprot:768263-Hanusia_phi.AAC.4
MTCGSAAVWLSEKNLSGPCETLRVDHVHQAGSTCENLDLILQYIEERMKSACDPSRKILLGLKIGCGRIVGDHSECFNHSHACQVRAVRSRLALRRTRPRRRSCPSRVLGLCLRYLGT